MFVTDRWGWGQIIPLCLRAYPAIYCWCFSCFCSGHASISAHGLDLMNGLLMLDPSTRTSAAEALKHPWFTTEKPEPTPIGQMPQVRVMLSRAAAKESDFSSTTHDVGYGNPHKGVSLYYSYVS